MNTKDSFFGSTSYLLRGEGTKLQSYNFSTLVWDDLSPTYTVDAEFGFYDQVEDGFELILYF